MEAVDRRKMNNPEPEEKFDDFRPTLAGFQPLNDAILLRELNLPDESMIATPDAYAEPCLYCEVIADRNFGTYVGYDYSCNEVNKPRYKSLLSVGDIVRILKGIGTTIAFSDTEAGQRYFTVNYQDIIGKWSK